MCPIVLIMYTKPSNRRLQVTVLTLATSLLRLPTPALFRAWFQPNNISLEWII